MCYGHISHADGQLLARKDSLVLLDRSVRGVVFFKGIVAAGISGRQATWGAVTFLVRSASFRVVVNSYLY